MKIKRILIASFIALITISAVVFLNKDKDSQDNNYNEIAYLTEIKTTSDAGFDLLKENCYVCHNPAAKSHDDLLAPPLMAVKMRYSKQYTSKEEFIAAIVDWVQHPTEEKALMKGAVNNFKVMPSLPIEVDEIKKIAAYIYENDLEQPNWFPEHMKKMHKNQPTK